MYRLMQLQIDRMVDRQINSLIEFELESYVISIKRKDKKEKSSVMKNPRYQQGY